MSYLATAFDARETHQQQAILGRPEMVANSEGGFVFEAGDWERLARFLVIGSEGGSFYANEQQLTRENADVVLRCLREDGPRTVREIVAVSEAGRAPKNDQALYALALATVPAYADEATRRAAFDVLPLVARTGTHLFMFCSFVDGMRSWGQGLKGAVSRWYTEKDPDQLAYQAVKYRQREGWTHRDVLRSAHPHPRDFPGGRGSLVVQWILDPLDAEEREHTALNPEMPEAIEAFEAARDADGPEDIVAIIGVHGNRLPHEAIPTQFKANGDVWMALLEAGMPVGAMVRNLANMTRYGILDPLSEGERIVTELLGNEEAIAKSRLHPMAVLNALRTYANGGQPIISYWGNSYESREQWVPNRNVVDALDAAFYTSFGNVEPSGKRFLLGLDVSGSMSQPVGAARRRDGRSVVPTPLLCSEAACAMALVTDRVEPRTHIAGFSHQLQPLGITSRMRLDEATRTVARMTYGTTNCSAPMEYALRDGLEVDAFVVLTDNETYAGRIHPSQALQKYRRETGIDARMIVVAMTANGFTIADPEDAGMLDVVGFDTATPKVISDFAAGLI